MLNIVDLKSFELLVKNTLELVSVSKRVQSVREYSHYFMCPEFEDVLFSLIEILIGLINSLEYFGNISHIEDIVTFGGGWQEILLNCIEEIDSRLCHIRGKVLDFVIEALEFKGANGLEDSLHIKLRRDGVVD